MQESGGIESPQVAQIRSGKNCFTQAKVKCAFQDPVNKRRNAWVRGSNGNTSNLGLVGAGLGTIPRSQIFRRDLQRKLQITSARKYATRSKTRNTATAAQRRKKNST